MSKCIVISVNGGTINNEGDRKPTDWSNCVFWQFGSELAFSQGVMKAKVDYTLFKTLKDRVFPAIVDADFVQTTLKDARGRDIAGSMLAELTYLCPLTSQDFKNLASQAIQFSQPVQTQQTEQPQISQTQQTEQLSKSSVLDKITGKKS